jgi:hypothetical protein
VCTSVSTGTPSSRFTFGQDLEAAFHARAAVTGARGAVGLVEAALEDEGDAQRAGDFLELSGHVHLELLGLDDAGAGDQKERALEADVESTKLHAGTFRRQATALRLLPAA